MATPTTPFRLSVLMLVLVSGSAVAADPRELVTAPDAVLCLDAGSLDQAGDGPAAGAQHRLRSLGCLKSPAGVPATLLSASEEAGKWTVRFRPQGMSGGITMWARPSAFTLPDGTPLRSQRAEK
jgi:hypothetical protein